MSFTRRYLLWLLIPPIVISIPPALLFLSQVVQLTSTGAGMLALMLVVMYAGGCVLFTLTVRPYAEAVEEAIRGRGDLSTAMSECLDRTKTVSIALWVGGGLVFAAIAAAIFMRSVLGFAYFIVSSLIAAFVSVVWGYAMGKHRLNEAASEAGQRVHYTGNELSLGKKIAIVFIGSLTISMAALTLLISSRVSSTLEILAITSASDRFTRVLDSASIPANVDEATLETLRLYIPAEYSLHVIDRQNGSVIKTKQGDPLAANEIDAIRKIGSGDSRAFIGPHVIRFQLLKDNRSILVLAIPWTPYKNIPFQITFYTIIVALLTTIVFGAATIVLSRDVTRPLRELRELSREMAEGNFDVAPRVFADDEVGQLADSFGETRSNLRRLLGRVGGSGSTITDGVRVITGGTEMLLSRSQDQTDLTQSSSLALENVRGGIGSVLGAADTVSDLTQDASARALELQASAEEVARSMDVLFQSVEKTSSSTTEMNASMNEMSNRTEVLAGIGDEVLSFVSEMDSTVSELLSSSHSTAELAQQVREDASAGGAAVNRTVEGIEATHELTMSTAKTIDELQRSVGQISQILNVIEEVANRTNLLSLNAAIIAAQAGEHGAGFTVVADEIRELAERTRGSTKEIGTIIKAVQSGSRTAVQKMHEGVARVTDNVKLAQDAAQSLGKIVASATRSFEMATRISRALSEQSSASRRLHEVTSRMSDHISEINRATREQARGTQMMAQESERVRDIAAQVKSATEEQSLAGKGITIALEKIADDARAMRDLLERQLQETDRIADASRVMLDIAQKNDAIAREFNVTVQNLVRSGQDFESEVTRFRFKGADA
ncbi:MAG TPA: methyl-accepting chemotaxis protein [Thermoanaerobaculia bacterium]|jgi:methyl-accepting chemotaxis protein|nr:methyl-accepting chemotaxis protein [Thermoanaerobaculia bacterium]